MTDTTIICQEEENLLNYDVSDEAIEAAAEDVFAGSYTLGYPCTGAVCLSRLVRLFTRNGADWSKRYPRIVEEAGRIKANAVMDAEVVFRQKTRLAFHEQSERQTALVILKQVHIPSTNAEHLGHLGLGLVALAAELPKLRSWS